jgi:hypothetical protein
MKHPLQCTPTFQTVDNSDVFWMGIWLEELKPSPKRSVWSRLGGPWNLFLLGTNLTLACGLATYGDWFAIANAVAASFLGATLMGRLGQ